MLKVAADICGLHAQLMSSAEMTLWARVEGLKKSTVQRALWERKTLVKSWTMRGTLHLLPAKEYPLWQAALSTYDHYRAAYWLKYSNMTSKEMDRLIDAVGVELYDKVLTREELSRAVAKRTRSKKLGELVLGSWGMLLKPPSFMGKLCFAPSVGQKVQFTNPHSWLPKYEEMDPHESLLQVTRRYLRAFGPAARDDLARWWSGFSPAGALKTIKELGDEVAPVEVGNQLMWMHAADVEAMSKQAKLKRSLRLLPAFDQLVVNVSRRSEHLMPGKFKARVYRKSAWITPVVLVNGRMDGVWKYERKGDRMVVTVEPFVKLPTWARTAAKKEAESLADFTDTELDLTWGKI